MTKVWQWILVLLERTQDEDIDDGVMSLKAHLFFLVISDGLEEYITFSKPPCLLAVDTLATT